MKTLLYLIVGSVILLQSCSPDESLKDPLFEAAASGDIKALKTEIENGADINKRSAEDGLTPLLFAARKGELASLNTLIKLGADIKATDNEDNTVLHYASKAFSDNDKLFQVLLKAGADAKAKNAEGSDTWQYIIANDAGNLGKQESELLMILLESGYCPEKGDSQKTELHIIAEKCDAVTVINHLIEKCGFDPNAEDRNGWTPLHFAAQEGHFSGVEVLLKHGAKANAETKLSVGDPDARRSSSYFPARMTPLDMTYKAGKGKKNMYKLRKKLEESGAVRSEK